MALADRRVGLGWLLAFSMALVLALCDMCSGTALLYKIPKVVIGENKTFQGPEAHLHSRGVELVILDDPECIRLMEEFIAARPELWNEDIGE